MDSTPLQPRPQPQPQPLKPSASKLPIKRKAPFPQHHHQFLTPIPQPLAFSPLDHSPPSSSAPKPRLPPFKFHRIWTEPDEISFLQGLLQSHGLSFPKDLPIFYSNFSSSISQPYSRSQLSEKLRRLRKKFRVISSRLARGLNPSALSPHDQALFDLSKRLWSPEFSSTSPFGKSSSGFNLGFSLDHENNGIGDGNDFEDCDLIENDGELKMNEVNVNCDFGGGRDEVVNDGQIDGIVAKSVLDVFDECFKEVGMVFGKQGLVWLDTMERRWKEQRISELDVLGRRLRLVIENSLTRR
ncbi:probable transcription factor At5g28040 [Herrania umbratica]|uniref:Probable transcription factor At5g28040 n=1 Tax=Herrania umbratica TaxID=108875 RepID=A0A6J1BBV7_9ROSI|nr:probable transcription factor At5g28040 [Herrania umbratica]